MTEQELSITLTRETPDSSGTLGTRASFPDFGTEVLLPSDSAEELMVDLAVAAPTESQATTISIAETRPDSQQGSPTPESDAITVVKPELGTLSPGALVGKNSPDNSKAGLKIGVAGDWMLWAPETVSILFSLAALMTIVGLLRSYNDRGLQSLPFNITLNAVISFFSSISKACLMIPIATCVGQMKWNWFHHGSHPLADFELFDASSRGVWGSLKLLYRVRWRHIASLAALVTTLGLVTTSASQLLISYDTRSAPSDELALIRAVKNFKFARSFDVYYAAQSGAFSSYLEPVQPLAPVCRTGNCTFPTVQSLSICHRIANVTPSVNVRVIDPALVRANDSTISVPGLLPTNLTEYNVTLPYGPYMVTQSLTSVAVLPLKPTTSIAFNEDAELMATQILSFGVIFSSPYDWGSTRNLSSSFYAFEVMFHACVNSYNASVVDTNVTSDVVASSYQVSPRSSGAKVRATCYMLTFLSANPTCEFWDYFDEEKPKLYLKNPERPGSDSVDDLYGTDLYVMGYLANVLANSFSMFLSSDNRMIFDWQGIRSSGLLQRTFEDLQVDEVATTPEVIYDQMNVAAGSVAMAISNSMRAQLAPSNTTSYPTENITYGYDVMGMALANETYVRVNWGWLSFLSSQLVLAAVILVLTVVETQRSRTKVLKSSSIAALVILEDDVRARMGSNDIATYRRMEKRAAKVQARLENGMLTLVESNASG